MTEGFPDGLLQYRKKLHDLLHNNDSPASSTPTPTATPNLQTRPKSSLRRQPPTKSTISGSTIPKVGASVKFEEIKPKIVDLKKKLEAKITDLENIIDMKNKKIVILSKSNLEKVEVIKNLNGKIKKLDTQSREKDSKIEELEKIIIKMQAINRDQQRETELDRERHEMERRLDQREDQLLDDEIFNISTSSRHNHSVEVNDDAPHTLELADIDSDMNLNTQQLMDLDLRELTFHPKGTETSDQRYQLSSRSDQYRSSTHSSGAVACAYNSNEFEELDSDLEEYLFEI